MCVWGGGGGVRRTRCEESEGNWNVISEAMLGLVRAEWLEFGRSKVCGLDGWV